MVELQLLAYDRIRYGNDQGSIAFDFLWRTVTGIRFAHDRCPGFANAILERILADFVSIQKPIQNAAQIPSFAGDGAMILWNASKIGYEVFRFPREFVGFVGHSAKSERRITVERKSKNRPVEDYELILGLGLAKPGDSFFGVRVGVQILRERPLGLRIAKLIQNKVSLLAVGDRFSNEFMGE